jgi:hypothetical protein
MGIVVVPKRLLKYKGFDRQLPIVGSDQLSNGSGSEGEPCAFEARHKMLVSRTTRGRSQGRWHMANGLELW